MKMKNVFIVLSLLMSLQIFAKSNEKGNGGTGIVFNENKATLADYYFKSKNFEPFVIEEDVKKEVMDILLLADYFKLSLLSVEDCQFPLNENCNVDLWKDWDIRVVSRLRLDKSIKIDSNKLSKNQVNELKYMMTYGYTNNKTTWIAADFFDQLSLKDKALALIHERLHLEFPKAKHDYIMWYISGLSKLRNVDQKTEKYTKETFEYLKKYVYLSSRMINNEVFNFKIDVFGNFKYTENDEALVFFNDKKDMSKINLKFNFINDPKSLKYLNLMGLELSENSKNITLGSSVDILKKFPQTANQFTINSIEVDGDNNKIIFGRKLLGIYASYFVDSGRPIHKINGNNNEITVSMKDASLFREEAEVVPSFDIKGNNNLMTISDLSTNSQNVVKGNQNVVFSSNVYINGNDNSLSQVNKNNSSVRIIGNANKLVSVEAGSNVTGNDNLIVNSSFYSVLGNKNIISNIVKTNDYAYVDGDSNVLSEIKIYTLNGNNNFISSRKETVNDRKENRMIENSKRFWSKNDHEKEKTVISEVQAIVEEVFSKVSAK